MWLLFSMTCLTDLVTLVELLQVLVDDLAGFFTVEWHRPSAWESRP